MGKGKVSKNSRTSKNVVNTYTKPVKPKKETILVELTEKVKDELVKDSQNYLGKEILGNKVRFGKTYLIIDNKEI